MDPGHVYHLFPIRTPRRTALQATCARRHRNARALPGADSSAAGVRVDGSGRLPARPMRAANEVLSLPLHPGLSPRRRQRRSLTAVRKDSHVRALITGGAGFIGSHLAEALLEQGHEVDILDNLSTGSIDNIAHLKPNRGSSTSSTRSTNEPLLAELIDRSDVDLSPRRRRRREADRRSSRCTRSRPTCTAPRSC